MAYIGKGEKAGERKGRLQPRLQGRKVAVASRVAAPVVRAKPGGTPGRLGADCAATGKGAPAGAAPYFGAVPPAGGTAAGVAPAAGALTGRASAWGLGDRVGFSRRLFLMNSRT